MLHICEKTGKETGDLIKKGFTKAGTQRFYCKECGKTFVLEVKSRRRESYPHYPTCCDNRRLIRNGFYYKYFDEYKTMVMQRYKCTSCNKKFSKELEYIPYSEEQFKKDDTD